MRLRMNGADVMSICARTRAGRPFLFPENSAWPEAATYESGLPEVLLRDGETVRR